MNKETTSSFDVVLKDVIKDMVFIVKMDADSVLRYDYFNQAVLAKTALTQNDLGKTFIETHGPAIAERLTHFYGLAWESKEQVIFKDSYMYMTNDIRYSETTLTPLINENNQVTSVAGVVKDITAEKLAVLESEKAWEKLKESRSRYRSLYENNSDAIFFLNLDGKILDGNQKVEKTTGFLLADLTNKDFMTLLEPGKDFPGSLPRSSSAGSLLSELQTKFRTKLGNLIPVLITFSVVEVKGEIIGVYAVVKDLSEMERLSSEYNQSESRFRVITENLHDGVVLIDYRGIILYASPSCKRISGFEAEEQIGKSPFQSVHPEDLPNLRNTFLKSIPEGETYILEVRLKHKTKDWVWTEVKGTPVFDGDFKFLHMVMIIRDITVQKAQQEQLRYYAYHDSLTGLPNRRQLYEYLANRITVSEEYRKITAIILLDIDHFKAINDQYGHEMGDAVIEKVGNHLSRFIDDNSFVARLGGDEFVLVLTGDRAEQRSKEIFGKIQASLKNDGKTNEEIPDITVSMGISITSLTEETVSGLLKKADGAMYESKKSGRNRYHIYR